MFRGVPGPQLPRFAAWLALGVALLGCATPTPTPGAPPLRLYVFDCGQLRFTDVSSFGLGNDETAVRTLFVPCYLIEHPRGRLLWDAGLPLEGVGAGWLEPEPGMAMRYDRGLPEQLAALGLAPADIDYVALSHMHFDHVGAAAAFPDATLVLQRAEWIAAFAEVAHYPAFVPGLYADLEATTPRLLDGDLDLFGDGSVRMLAAPGHTPGHQVLYLELPETGPLLLSGDLWHFRFSRAQRRVPVFNTDRAQTLAAMTRIENLLAETGAALWIEHDAALARTLRLAPAFYQ
jgi:N-acyl homoserine lactone hydrolase